MAELGRICVFLAFFAALIAVFAGIEAARSGNPRSARTAKRAIIAVFVTTTAAFAVLEAAFFRSDFHFLTVASHSSLTTPIFYRLSAAWSSQEGSLLLWVWLLSLWSVAALIVLRRRLEKLLPVVLAVLGSFAAFFCALLIFYASPFETTAVAALDGTGLSPLLRHPSMMIHPPLLYSGYTLLAVPFALTVAASFFGELNQAWITETRRFALVAWIALTFGIILGARWSYAELGWGGYWAWDPVENASLMPWLVLTAFIHSLMVQQRRGIFKVWNVSLILAAGILAILGTFLVRSGVLSSIHAFGASTLGVPFLTLLGVMTFGSIALVAWRRNTLASQQKLDALLSRETLFVLNNLIFVLLCGVIFWGTFFPLISEVLTGRKITVGAPWFTQFIVPLAFVLIALTMLGPLVEWRKMTARQLVRGFVTPFLFTVAVMAVSLVFGLAKRPAAFAMTFFCVLLITSLGWQFITAILARSRAMQGHVMKAAVTVARENRRRYGGYLVHSGIAIIFFAIAVSSAFQHAKDVTLRPGEKVNVGGYQLQYLHPTAHIDIRADDIERIVFGAKISVRRSGGSSQKLTPEYATYPSLAVVRFGPIGRFFEGERTSEVAVQSGLRRDLWIAVTPDLSGLMTAVNRGDRLFEKAGSKLPADARAALLGKSLRAFTDRYRNFPPPATFRIIVSPLVSWIWLGAILALLGALSALSATRDRGSSSRLSETERATL